MLARLDQFRQEVMQTNKTKAKKQILSNYLDLRPVLKRIMDPLKTTGVTSKTILRYEEKKYPQFDPRDCPVPSNLCDLLDALFERKLTGHTALETCVKFLELHSAFRETILKCLDGDLKIRLKLRQMNQVFPDQLVPEFSVALGEDFSKKEKQFSQSQKQNDQWWISRKLDGVRCLTFVTGENVICRSRLGNAFVSLRALQGALRRHGAFFPDIRGGWVLDGEICVIDSDGKENFKAAVSQIKRKSVQMKQLSYYIFDVLTRQEFEQKESKCNFSHRYERRLLPFVGKLNPKMPSGIRLVPVEQTLYCKSSMELLTKQMADQNWEGLILRKDAPYKGKRSADILKYKKFFTADYRVEFITCGPMQVMNKESGLMQEEKVMTAVAIRHKDSIVQVGSGFTVEQRRQFRQNPDAIVGQLIEVQYFEESEDRDGNVSLRFPTVKCIWGAERAI